MKAVVLAAGVGSRLGKLTGTVPKCMVRVGGVPVLERNLRWLREAGVTDVAVNLHHLPNVVTDHFGDASTHDLRILWKHEPELLGTAGTIASLTDWLRHQTFLVVYGDNLFELDVSACVDAHRRSGAVATVALFEREDVSASGVAELTSTGRVARFIEKPHPGETESRLVNAGLLVLDPRALAMMPERGDLARDVLPQLAEAGALQGHRLAPDERLLWIDTPADLARTAALAAGRVG